MRGVGQWAFFLPLLLTFHPSSFPQALALITFRAGPVVKGCEYGPFHMQLYYGTGLPREQACGVPSFLTGSPTLQCFMQATCCAPGSHCSVEPFTPSRRTPSKSSFFLRCLHTISFLQIQWTHGKNTGVFVMLLMEINTFQGNCLSGPVGLRLWLLVIN